MNKPARTGFEAEEIIITPPGYRRLKQGERLAKGDIVWTWANPKCTFLGWIDVTPNDYGEVVGPGMVPCARLKSKI